MIEKVVNEEDVKLFRLRGVLDLVPLLSVFRGASFLFESPLPVRNEGHDIIGSACPVVEDLTLTFNITIDYHCPERLSIQTGSQHYIMPNLMNICQGDSGIAITIPSLVLSSRRGKGWSAAVWEILGQ